MAMASRQGAIIGVPVETIFQIFTYVKYDAPFDVDGLGYSEKISGNNADIKNLRLTCRRFSEIAAPLLLKAVSCSIFEAKSLEALESISKHAVFSRHVKVVHVHLGYYAPAIFEDMNVLAEYLITMWSEYRRRKRRIGDVVLKVEYLVEETTKYWKHLADRRVISHSMRNNPTFQQSQRALSLIHQEYCRRYIFQQNMRRSGQAIQRVGQAMARMQSATRLVMDDDRHRGPTNLGRNIISVLGNGPKGIIDSDLSQLVTPLSWYDTWRFKSDHFFLNRSVLKYFRVPFDLIIDLPVACHRAGVKLTGLRVLNMEIPKEVPAWDCIEPYNWITHPPLNVPVQIRLAEPDELNEACKHLKVLEITPEYAKMSYQLAYRPSTTLAFRHYTDFDLTRFSGVVDEMVADSLLEVRIECESILYVDEHVPGVQSTDGLFEACRWPNLQVLQLKNAKIRNTESLLKMLRDLPDLAELRLDHVALISFYRPANMAPQAGWSFLLDSLRELAPTLRENGKRLGRRQPGLAVQIRDARVGAMGKLDQYFSSERYQGQVDDMFNNQETGYTKVDDYVRGAANSNPLVELNSTIKLLCERLEYADMPYDLNLHPQVI